MSAHPPAGGHDDAVFPFQLDGSAVRGRMVKLGAVVDEVLSRHAYAPPVSVLLGEALALAALLGSALKFDGKLILQIKGSGPVSLLVTDYETSGGMRAYAGVEETKPLPADASAKDLLGEGYFALTIDQGPDTDRYQGVVPLDGTSLADFALAYFSQSEQIPTALELAVGRSYQAGGEGETWRAGGIMAQFMPGEGGARERGEAELLKEVDEEEWLNAATLLSTTQADELLDPTLPPEDLLYRLFHEGGVRAFEPAPLAFRCGCTREKIVAVLSRYEAAELAAMAEEDGRIHVTCEFCNEAYEFDPNRVE